MKYEYVVNSTLMNLAWKEYTTAKRALIVDVDW